MEEASVNPWPTESTQMARQSATATPDLGNKYTHEYNHSNMPTEFTTTTFHDMACTIAALGDQHRLYTDNQLCIGLAFESVTAQLHQISTAFEKLNASPCCPRCGAHYIICTPCY